MKCNLNNINSMSFGSIHCISGGEQFLRKNLNKAQVNDLRKLIDSQKNNPVDITLVPHTDKRLSGWTVFEEETNGKWHRKDYTQRLLFESPIDFIKRLCKKADSLKEKFQGDIKENHGENFELHM